MKLISKLVFVVGVSFAGHAFAEETVKEKATATKNDVKRAAKKGAHKVGEAVCLDSDVTCAAKKAGNRVEEAKDVVKDKVDETKNKVD